MLQHIGQPWLRILALKLASTEEGIHHGSSTGSRMVLTEKIIFSTHHHLSYLSFTIIVRKRHFRIFHIHLQFLSSRGLFLSGQSRVSNQFLGDADVGIERPGHQRDGTVLGLTFLIFSTGMCIAATMVCIKRLHAGIISGITIGHNSIRMLPLGYKSFM